MGRWWGYPAAVILGLGFTAGCSDDDDGPATSAGGAPSFGLDDLSDDAEVTEVGLDLTDDFDRVVGVAALEDVTIAVTGDGLVIRSTDGDDWDQEEDVEGLGDSVYGLTRLESSVVAFTGDGMLRSGDGLTWEPIDSTGIEVAEVDAMTRTDTGVLALAGGSDGYTLYTSVDGEDWDSEETEGLADSDTFQAQSVVSLATLSDVVVASLGAEFKGSSDDYVFGIWTSTDRGVEWTEVGTGNDVDGLEELELPNSDALPVLVGVEDGFLALGGDQDAEVTVWRSEGGEKWGDPIALGGPELEFPYEIDAATTTGDGVVAMVLLDNDLTVWTLSTG